MEFPFTFDISIETNCVTQIDGVLVIEEDYSLSRRSPDWRITEIKVDAVRPHERGTFEVVRVPMPEGHWLYKRITADVLDRYRRDIDDAWAAQRAAIVRPSVAAF